MSETIVIECRQLNENTKIMSNGDYTVDTESVSIENGDSIIIRNSFVDSIPVSNQFVTLSEDYSITIDFFYYNYIWGYGGVSTNTHFAFSGTVNDPAQPNIPYGQSNNGLLNNFPSTLCNLKEITTGDFQKYETIIFNKIAGSSGNWGNIPFIIQYSDFENGVRIYHGKIPPLTNTTSTITIKVNIIGKSKTSAYPPIIVIEAGDLQIGKIQSTYNNLNNLTAETLANIFYYEPILGSKTVTVPKGKYTPVELGQLISKLFQTVIQADLFNADLITNDLLIVSGTITPNHQFVPNMTNDLYFQYMRPGGQPTSFNQPAQGKNLYIPVYNYNLPGNKQVFWVGSSQFDLQFNPDTSKFFFEYLHTPFYAAAGTGIDSPEVIQVNSGLHIPAKHADEPPQYSFRPTNFITKANGGIALNSLRSTPSGFWDDILGFEIDNICVSPQYFLLDPSVTGNTAEYLLNQQVSYLPFLDLVEGKTITAPFLINDMAVQKNTNFQMKPLLSNSDKYNIVGINSIVAQNVLLNNLNTNAYYLIEIESKFKNNVYTSDKGNMKNIQAIANTYFNSNNYTSSSSADSIIYTHSGEPQILQSFGIRILDSTKNLAPDLGPDNCIFIEIVKALKMTQELTPPTTKLLKNQTKAEDGKIQHRET